MGLLDNEPLEIECPKCRKPIKKPLRWFKQNQRCPHGCGTTFEASDFRRQIDKAESDLKRLGFR